MTIRCAIVDDEPLARTRLARLLAREPGCVVTGAHGNARAAVEALRADPPDVLFLDIAMPGLDGFELLAALPAAAMPVVIFVTAHDTFAVRAFEHRALDYLLKPISAERFHTAVSRAREHLALGAHAAEARRYLAERGDLLAIKTADGAAQVRLDEIDWIESADNYVEIHAGDRCYLVRESLRGLEARLAHGRFARIHRQTIVALDRIRELEPIVAGDWVVVLRAGTRLRMSRTYRRRVLERLGAPP